MVALLRNVVVRAMAAGYAGEGKLVKRRALELGAVAFAGGRIFGSGFVLRLLLRGARDRMCEAALVEGSCRCDGDG